MASLLAIPTNEHFAALYGGLKETELQLAAAVCIGQCQGCMCSCRCSCSGGFLSDLEWDE